VGLARRGVIPQNNSTSECFFCDPVVLAILDDDCPYFMTQ
jgi:hypothetical protein